MKRLLPILATFICVVLCFFCLAPSASAAGIDYNDYVTNVLVDGDNDRVTVSLPTDQFFWRLSWDDSYVDYEGSSFTHEYVFGPDYYLGLFSPFIDATQIPDGTQIYVTVDFGLLSGGGAWGSPEYFGNVYYSNGEGASVSLGKDVYGLAEFTHILEYNGSDSFRVSLGANNFGLATPDYGNITSTSRVRSCIMEFSISSLLRLQQTTGKTNKILQAVEDAINNPADPQAPEGDSIIQDSIQNENELLNDAKDNWQHADVIFDNAQTDISFYAPTFLAVSGMIDSFVGIPFIQTLLQVSLSLGIVAVILSIALNPKNFNRGDNAKSKGGKN